MSKFTYGLNLNFSDPNLGSRVCGVWKADESEIDDVAPLTALTAVSKVNSLALTE